MNGYDLSRQWFDFAFENPDKVSGNHTALYWWSIELNNRLGWVKKFGIPSDVAMTACGIRSYKTYSKIFNDLVEWGFFDVHQRSKNQYTSNVIALVFFTEAIPKQYQSIDQSITNALPKHSSGTVGINKQETNKTYKQDIYEDTPDSNKNKQAVTKTFKPPKEEEVKAYFQQKNVCSDRAAQEFANKFWSFYENNGWKVGKNRMKDWHLAISTWSDTGESLIKKYPLSSSKPSIVSKNSFV